MRFRPDHPAPHAGPPRAPRHGPEAARAVEIERTLRRRPTTPRSPAASSWACPGADSIVDRTIPTFSRGELPHFAGIHDVPEGALRRGRPPLRRVRRGRSSAPRSTAAPPTGRARGSARRASATSRCSTAPTRFELGVDLRESITMCDLGDIFTIPANIEKTFDQITKAVSHVYASGAFPVVLGGDHSIGYPTSRGVAENLDGKLGIIHFDRHVDTQETDLDERMHTTPWFHATDLPNVPAGEPRPDRDRRLAGARGPGVAVGREREHDDPDRHRLRRDGDRGGRRAGPRGRLGRRRRGVAVLRHRLPRRRVRPRHRLARARRVPAARGPQVHPARLRRTPARRHRGRRVLPALRQRRDHLAHGDPGDRRRPRVPGRGPGTCPRRNS